MDGGGGIAGCGVLLGALGISGLVHAARSGPRGAPGVALGLGAGLVAAAGEGLWLGQVGFLSTAGAGLLVVPAAGLAVGLLAVLAGQWRLRHQAPPERRLPGYELLSVLGTGAGTAVYLARQLDLD